MSYRLLFIIHAVVVFAFGLFLLVTPETALAQFRMDARVTEVFLTRAIGAALASLGLALFFARDVEEPAQKFLAMASLAGVVLALIVTLIGVAGTIRQNGWILIVVEILFGLGYAFVLFIQPRMQPPQEE